MANITIAKLKKQYRDFEMQKLTFESLFEDINRQLNQIYKNLSGYKIVLRTNYTFGSGPETDSESENYSIILLKVDERH